MKVGELIERLMDCDLDALVLLGYERIVYNVEILKEKGHVWILEDREDYHESGAGGGTKTGISKSIGAKSEFFGDR